MTLTWTLIEWGNDPMVGGEFLEDRCDQHERITRLRQRPNREADWSESYHVAGLMNYYHSDKDAIAASEANP
jgi:hypothetical protein